jgi:hypothetical protein
VFPDADDGPALPAELPGDEPIALFVAGQFLFPEGAVVGRHVRVFWTAVPETAAHEAMNRVLGG